MNYSSALPRHSHNSEKPHRRVSAHRRLAPLHLLRPSNGKVLSGILFRAARRFQVQCQSTTSESHSYPDASPYGSLSETSSLQTGQSRHCAWKEDNSATSFAGTISRGRKSLATNANWQRELNDSNLVTRQYARRVAKRVTSFASTISWRDGELYHASRNRCADGKGYLNSQRSVRGYFKAVTTRLNILHTFDSSGDIEG